MKASPNPLGQALGALIVVTLLGAGVVLAVSGLFRLAIWAFP